MALDVTDYTSNGNDLTNNNGVVEETTDVPNGSITTSADFVRASSQSLSIADASQTGLDVTNLTFEAWIKIESFNAENKTIASKWDSGFSWIFQIKNSNAMYFWYGNGSGGYGGLSQVAWTPDVDTWYHVAVSYDSSAGNVKFYVNGSQQGTTQSIGTGKLSNVDAPFRIGVYGASTGFWDGKMAEIRVWDDVRSDAEISANYAAHISDPTSEANLVGYWPLETAGTTTSTSTSTSTTSSSTSTSTTSSSTSTSTTSSSTSTSTTSSSTSTSTSTSTTSSSSSTSTSITTSTSTSTTSSSSSTSTSTSSSTSTTSSSTSTSTSTTSSSSSTSTSISTSTSTTSSSTSTTSSSTSTSTTSSSSSSTSTTSSSTSTTSSSSSTSTSTTTTTLFNRHPNIQVKPIEVYIPDTIIEFQL